jgi:5-methylcytosine-specific restriction protein A
VTILQAYEAIAKSLALTPEQMAIPRSGDLRYRHEIRFARDELQREGILKSFHDSGRGVWELVDGLGRALPSTTAAEPEAFFFEGATRSATVSRYERSPGARLACLGHHGHSCVVCSFDFAEVFGPLGKGLIHVHHLVPLSEISEAYVVDPITDLVPLCPNCHYMAHRRDPPFGPEELRAMRQAARNA